MKRDEVLQTIEPLVEGQVRDVPDTAGVRVNVAPDMITMRPRKGAQLLEVDPKGAKNIVNFAGLPLGVVKALSPNTFGQALSEILEGIGKYSLIVKESKVVDIVKYGERKPIEPGRLLTTIERIIPVQDYNRVTVTPNRMVSLEVIGEKTMPVARGDLVRAGVMVNFSPMGFNHPVVQSYALVLACTNGATANNILAEFTGGRGGSGGEGDDIWHFFRESIKKAYGSFGEVVDGWKRLAAENVTDHDRATMLEALIRQARLPREVADAVRAMAIERPPRNAWAMHNLITYASSHLLEAPAEVARAQQTAADFGSEERHARTCPICHRAR